MHPDPRAVERRVIDYLSARLRWEAQAQRLYELGKGEGLVSEQLREIQARYIALVAEFFTKDAVDRAPRGAFSSPPSVDPNTAGIVSVQLKDEWASVLTEEMDFGPTGRREYEYELRFADGTWRIHDRVTRDHQNRKIRRVF